MEIYSSKNKFALVQQIKTRADAKLRFVTTLNSVRSKRYVDQHHRAAFFACAEHVMQAVDNKAMHSTLKADPNSNAARQKLNLDFAKNSLLEIACEPFEAANINISIEVRSNSMHLQSEGIDLRISFDIEDSLAFPAFSNSMRIVKNSKHAKVFECFGKLMSSAAELQEAFVSYSLMRKQYSKFAESFQTETSDEVKEIERNLNEWLSTRPNKGEEFIFAIRDIDDEYKLKVALQRISTHTFLFVLYVCDNDMKELTKFFKLEFKKMYEATSNNVSACVDIFNNI